MIDRKQKIYIAGHRGLVGSAILRKLEKEGFTNFVLKTSAELDLKNQKDVEVFFETEKPDIVILAAAKVGGIMANIKEPATFLYDNLMIQNNVINSAYKNGVKKLLFLGSSCIYPRISPQPMKEEYLLDGKVEPTNEGYAIAKIAGIKLCDMYNKQYGTNYISVMPCNLYGEGDNFDLLKSHVVPALIRRFHEAKESNQEVVIVWGTGNPRRELMFSDEVAEACLFILDNYKGTEMFNIGQGVDYSISELAHIIKKVVGYKGEIQFDSSKPDGMPQKLMDVTKLKELGWESKISLEEGIKLTYNWYIDNYSKFN